MNKLYYIVCDDKEVNVFEGRYQGRTRGEALKFLKQSIGRKTLNGLVFTITEIPVPLIREIVAEILGGEIPATPLPIEESPVEPEPGTPLAKPVPVASGGKPGNPGFGKDLWTQVKAYWEGCHSAKKTAEHFGLSPNTLKTRIRREGWNQ
jgi:hypothetical protein